MRDKGHGEVIADEKWRKTGGSTAKVGELVVVVVGEK